MHFGLSRRRIDPDCQNLPNGFRLHRLLKPLTDVFDTDRFSDAIGALISYPSPASGLIPRLNFDLRPIAMARHWKLRNSAFYRVSFDPTVSDCCPPLIRAEHCDLGNKAKIRRLNRRVPDEIYRLGILRKIIRLPSLRALSASPQGIQLSPLCFRQCAY
jgi:hypothetical protein